MSFRLPIRHRLLLGMTLAAMLSMGAYLWAAHREYRAGFPLDDAWIYQTFARTWATTGTWGLRADQPAAGATAPLWVLPMALVHKLWPDAGPVGAWLMGLGLLAAMALLVMREAQRDGLSLGASTALGLIFLLEWHLVWAALSGMETLAFGLLAWWVLRHLDREHPSWGKVGWLLGLGVWLRPEAVLLLLPWAWRVGWIPRFRERLRAFLATGFPLLVLLVLYVTVQLLLTGHPWPNTGQAKVMEYAAWREGPFLVRWLRMALPPLIGPGLLFLPWGLYGLVRHGRAWVWGEALWVLAHITAYAWRLPAPYQHGRYVIPIIPVLLWWGARSFIRWQQADGPKASGANPADRWGWRMQTFTRFLAVFWVLGFWFLGMRAYAADTAFIESNLVDTARWVARYIPPEEEVAAHDIGALGYFAPQPVVDLAGLVNPEVIPFLRDPVRLAAYLENREVRYLVLFPDWYGPDFVYCSAVLHRAQARGYPPEQAPDLVVYRWRPCPPGHR